MISCCKHPNCHRQTKRHFCGRHWHALDDDLQRRLGNISSKNMSAFGALMIEIEEYFQGRMIGELEIVRCTGRAPDYVGCGADIVWLVTKSGKNQPVNAETVEPGDDQFEYGRHISHFATCPLADGFRR